MKIELAEGEILTLVRALSALKDKLGFTSEERAIYAKLEAALAGSRERSA